MTLPELRLLTAEYVSILHAAGREGWLTPLLAAHYTPCTQAQAERVIEHLRAKTAMPRVELSWRNRRGRARCKRRQNRYLIGLPFSPGTGFARLRLGLVLHEAAHILDYATSSAPFGHDARFRAILRRLVMFEWRKFVTSEPHYRPIYSRHPGPYSLLIVNRFKHSKSEVSDLIKGPLSAQQAHDKARELVQDETSNTVSAFVYSDKEGQFIGAQYFRGHSYPEWGGAGGMEMVDERKEGTLLPGEPESVRTLDDAGDGDAAEQPTSEQVDVPAMSAAEHPAAAKRTPRKRGLALRVNPDATKPWPPSPAAQYVKATVEMALDGQILPAVLVGLITPKLIELGVQFPASLVSRLKQNSLLIEVAG